MKIIDRLISDNDLKEILLRRDRKPPVETNINQQLISPQQYSDQKPRNHHPSAF